MATRYPLKTDGSTIKYNDGSGESDLSAGGGGSYDCIVASSGGDYTTIKAAIDDGNKSIFVSSDTSENSNITISDSEEYYIFIDKNCTVTFGSANYISIASGQTPKFIIDGVGTLVQGASSRIFEDAGSSAKITIRNITIDRSSMTGEDLPFDVNCVVNIDNCYIKLSNDDGDFKIWNGSIISNCTIEGGGSSCTANLELDDSTANNIKLTGEFSNAGIDAQGESVVSNVTNRCLSGTTRLNCSSSSVASNLDSLAEAVDFDLVVSGKVSNANNINDVYMGDGGYLSNCEVLGAIDINGDDQLNIVNCEIASVVRGGVADSIKTNQSKFTNCVFNCDIEIYYSQSDQNTFCNCVITGDVSFNTSDYVDYTTFFGCRVGSSSGGGTETITLGTKARYTTIYACNTDAAISGSPTGLQTSGNNVY